MSVIYCMGCVRHSLSDKDLFLAHWNFKGLCLCISWGRNMEMLLSRIYEIQHIASSSFLCARLNRWCLAVLATLPGSQIFSLSLLNFVFYPLVNILIYPSAYLLIIFLNCLFSGAEIGRFVTMLRNSSSILKACAAFALLQVGDFLCGTDILLISVFSTWTGNLTDLVFSYVVVHNPWWSSCTTSCPPIAEHWSIKDFACCCCSSHCPYWSQNLCSNRTSELGAPSNRILNLRPGDY